MVMGVKPGHLDLDRLMICKCRLWCNMTCRCDFPERIKEIFEPRLTLSENSNPQNMTIREYEKKWNKSHTHTT